MRLNRFIVVFVLLLFSSSALIYPISAQDEDDSEIDAEINARIVGDIPSIKVSDWTQIEIEITDAFGIDYRRLSEQVPRFIMEVIWPLNPSFPQPVKRYLGPMSIRLIPEIVEGNENGWQLRMGPSIINNTLSGDTNSATLEVFVDDSSIDNSVVVGIKCIRLDTFGEPIGTSWIYVPVKASPTNYIKMETLEDNRKTTAPKTIVDFTLDIKNEGYYKDVFEFEIEEENGLMALMNQQAVTMLPGETKRVTLEILTPEKLFDPGTPNEIRVYVRSTGNETETLVGTLIVITQGVHISPLYLIIAAPIIAFLVVLYIFFVRYKNKKDRELYGKPDKPWNLPAESQYLKELKKEDSEKYNQVLNMMKQEYESALLWWKSKQQQEEGSESFSFSNIFSKIRGEPKQKKEETEEKPVKKNKEEKKGKKKDEKPKKSKEKKDEAEVKEKKKPEKEEPKEKQKNSKEKRTATLKKKEESISNKVVNGLKKWFTVPEEEKQGKQSVEEQKQETVHESNAKEDAEKVEKASKNEKSEEEYEKEVNRIEEEQQKKRAQKRKEQQQLQKQKTIDKIKRAQEKQRQKLNK